MMTELKKDGNKGERHSYEYRIGQVGRAFNLSREMTSYDLAKLINLSQKNTHALLVRLEKEGYVQARRVVHRQLTTQTVYKKVWSWVGGK